MNGLNFLLSMYRKVFINTKRKKIIKSRDLFLVLEFKKY